MSQLRVPSQLVVKTDHMFNLFQELAIDYGHTQKIAEELIRLLPSPIRCSVAWLDVLTNIWRYDFGTEYNIGDRKVLGTVQWPPIKNL